MGSSSQYTQGFDMIAGTKSWKKIKEELEPKKAFVPMEEKEGYRKADYTIVKKEPEVQGLFLEPELFSVEPISRDQRNEGSFFFQNKSGFPIELKYRFSDELRDYPEKLHFHNVPELYFPEGSFRMKVSEKAQEQTEFTEIRIDSPTVIPSGVCHGITENIDGGDLIVARGDPFLGEEYVGKWSLKGEQLYDHFPEGRNPPITRGIEVDDIEMYQL